MPCGEVVERGHDRRLGGPGRARAAAGSAAVDGHEQHQRQDEEEVRHQAHQLRQQVADEARRAGRGRTTRRPSSICAWSTPDVVEPGRRRRRSAGGTRRCTSAAASRTGPPRPTPRTASANSTRRRRRPRCRSPTPPTTASFGQPPAQRMGEHGQHQREEHRGEDVGDALIPAITMTTAASADAARARRAGRPRCAGHAGCRPSAPRSSVAPRAHHRPRHAAHPTRVTLARAAHVPPSVSGDVRLARSTLGAAPSLGGVILVVAQHRDLPLAPGRAAREAGGRRPRWPG